MEPQPAEPLQCLVVWTLMLLGAVGIARIVLEELLKFVRHGAVVLTEICRVIFRTIANVIIAGLKQQQRVLKAREALRKNRSKKAD